VTLGLIALALAWKFIAPDAQQVVAVEWKRVLDSPLSASIRREIPPNATPVLANINFIEGIERAIWTPGLIVLEGSFDLDRLKDMAVGDGGLVKAYKRAQLIGPAGEEETQIGLVGPTLVLLGSADKMRAAIDRSEKATTRGPAGPAYDLWVRTTGKEFRRHDFGIQLANDVHVTSKLSYSSEALARTAIDNAATFGLTGAQAGMDALLNGRFSRQEFIQRQWRTTLESLQAPSIVPAAKPEMIRIYGLDEGVKQIPLK